MNFLQRLLALKFLHPDPNTANPTYGGGLIPNQPSAAGAIPPTHPSLPPMKPMASHMTSPVHAPAPISPVASHGPSLPPSSMAKPITPLGAPASSSVAGSGLPPELMASSAPLPSSSMSALGSPIEGGSPEPMPEPEAEPLDSSPLGGAELMGGLPGQSPQMKLNMTPDTIGGNQDLVSLIKRLIHKR